jgi:hypothetical protein
MPVDYAALWWRSLLLQKTNPGLQVVRLALHDLHLNLAAKPMYLLLDLQAVPAAPQLPQLKMVPVIRVVHLVLHLL